MRYAVKEELDVVGELLRPLDLLPLPPPLRPRRGSEANLHLLHLFRHRRRGSEANLRLSSAVSDCLDLLDLTSDEITSSISTSPAATGTGNNRFDLHSWLSAAVGNQDTCKESLEVFCYELAPRSWSEVSKALEDLKPSLHQTLPPKASPTRLPPPSSDLKNTPEKAGTFRTLEQLNAQLPSPNQAPSSPPRARSPPHPPPPELAGFKPVKENCFIICDRQERESKKAGGDSAANARWRRRNPLEGYPERCPPGNCDGVVLYTTTVRGVRRTFNDCKWARRAMEVHAVETGVEVEERDVSLHGEYLKELRELVGEGAALPRLFIRGRYVGGVEEVVELGETGKMREMLRWVAARGERGKGG